MPTKGKIVVQWDRTEKTVSPSEDGVSIKQSTWKEKEYPLSLFSDMEYPESIWDEETIMEDFCGDLHFRRERVLDNWDEKVKDDRYGSDEEADESMATIEFVKFVRSLPEGSWVSIEFNI